MTLMKVYADDIHARVLANYYSHNTCICCMYTSGFITHKEVIEIAMFYVLKLLCGFVVCLDKDLSLCERQ